SMLLGSLTVPVTLRLRRFADVPEFVVTTRSAAFAPSQAGSPETLVQVGGRVLDPAAQGVPGAFVDILDAGLHDTSDGDGRFSFLRVPVGSHNLRAGASGFQTKTQPLVVPGRPEDYEITLAPLP